MIASAREPLRLTRTVHLHRVMRRSVRCLAFGLLGLVPLLGLGLAFLAIRLHREVAEELGVRYRKPRLRSYWATGLVCVLGYDLVIGFPGAMMAFTAFALLQSRYLSRHLADELAGAWNPGDRSLRWGTGLAYTGCFGSWCALGLMVSHPLGSAIPLLRLL